MQIGEQMTINRFSRRSFLAGAALLLSPGSVHAIPPSMLVHKDPNCSCCTPWVAHIQAAGFQVKIREIADLAPIKARLAIPSALTACHTAEVDSYVVEGHVPASAISRLLAERPRATGLAVPGMPVGSPGMEVQGAADNDYEVVLFGPSLLKTFARFKGTKEVPDFAGQRP